MEESSVETTKQILARMKELLALLQPLKKYAGCIPFLYTYLLVTKRINQAGQRKGFFKNPEPLRQLDLAVAKLYFDPLETFIQTGTCEQSPWKTYYQYCRQPKPRAFVATLLGINAHINGDLPLALANTRYHQTADFEKIDSLLGEVVGELMRFLAWEYHDLQAMGGVLAPGFTQRAFKQMISAWRHQAWDNAQKISTNNFQQQRISLNQQTEVVGQRLIELFQHPFKSLATRSEWSHLRVTL